MNLSDLRVNPKRVEFGSLEQAELYLRICEYVLREHSIQLKRPSRRSVPERSGMCRSSSAINYSGLMSDLNIDVMAKHWVRHDREELEQAFALRFEYSIKIVAESGFSCANSPTSLAHKAVNHVIRAVEDFVYMPITGGPKF